jgi:hypothetical protein
MSAITGDDKLRSTNNNNKSDSLFFDVLEVPTASSSVPGFYEKKFKLYNQHLYNNVVSCKTFKSISLQTFILINKNLTQSIFMKTIEYMQVIMLYWEICTTMN